MELTKAKANELGTLAEKAVKDKLHEMGMQYSVKKGSGTFSDLEFTMKLTFAVLGGETQQERDYKNYASMFDLPLEMLGSTIANYGGKSIKVTGLYPSRRKNDLAVTNLADGRELVAPHEQVLRAWRKEHNA